MIAVRIGLGGRRFFRPHKAMGYGLIIVGGLIIIVAMPVFVYVAIFGAFICYIGYCIRGRY